MNEDLIKYYLDRGFGSMNKNDFEVWIFNYLLQNKYNNKSDNYISRDLRIPESKVKRLRYEANLVFPKTEDEYKKSFYKILKEKVYKEVGNNRIQFSINDKSLRLYLLDRLQSYGSFADSSFNSEIVTITANDLLLLISDFEKKDDVIEHVKKQIKTSSKELPQKLSEKCLGGLRAILKDIGADETTDFIYKSLGID